MPNLHVGSGSYEVVEMDGVQSYDSHVTDTDDNDTSSVTMATSPTQMEFVTSVPTMHVSGIFSVQRCSNNAF